MLVSFNKIQKIEYKVLQFYKDCSQTLRRYYLAGHATYSFPNCWFKSGCCLQRSRMFDYVVVLELL